MTTASQKKDLAERQANELALAGMYETDIGLGLELADAECYAIPFLKILQSLSPEIDADDSAHIEGAKVGMFLNASTGELYESDAGLQLVPAHFQRRFNKWRPRNSGGGFMGAFTPEEFAALDVTQNEKGQFVLADGNYFMDTREHFCIMVLPDGSFEPVLVAFTSTQIKKSRNWTSVMSKKKVSVKGNMVAAPTFAFSYPISTRREENDQGKWYGWNIGAGELVTNPSVYSAARKFRDDIVKGAAKVDHDSVASSTAKESQDVAF